LGIQIFSSEILQYSILVRCTTATSLGSTLTVITVMVQDSGADVLLRACPSYATVSWATADGFRDVASISTPLGLRPHHK